MASFDAKTFDELDGDDAAIGNQYNATTFDELDGFDGLLLEAPAGSGGTTDYFLMQGIDSACGPLTYHYWVVTGTSDPTGIQAGALPCGGPLTDIDISAEWSA